MSKQTKKVRVLLVEDDQESLAQFLRDLPDVFTEQGITPVITPCSDFSTAQEWASDGSHQFDLIVSDTYKGDLARKDEQVLKIVCSYQKGRKFCPLVIFSSSTRPDGLKTGPFTKWADKSVHGEIEQAINELLQTGVPQAANVLHAELDYSAGTYLWDFLGKNWTRLEAAGLTSPETVERIIRRRASIQIGDLSVDGAKVSARSKRDGLEYYIYPAIDSTSLNLGDIICSKRKKKDMLVVLTPHCQLTIQPDKSEPGADHVLTAKVIPVPKALGEKFTGAQGASDTTKRKRLEEWSKSPGRTNVRPAGRHWFLPGFLDIPHSFCDFAQIESLPYNSVIKTYCPLATVAPPYAEALQSCFLAFYGAVGLPDLNIDSIKDLLD